MLLQALVLAAGTEHLVSNKATVSHKLVSYTFAVAHDPASNITEIARFV